MLDSVSVTCPWCLETVELTLEPDVEGAFVQDCEVCCRPWSVHVHRRHDEEDEDGEPSLTVDVDRA